MRILVTGAAGFLGSQVVRIAADQGYSVRALVRRAGDGRLFDSSKVEIAIGDITDPGSVAQAMRGIAAVVHCAAVTSAAKPDWARSRRVNVGGTKAVIDAADEKVRWIQISSMSAHEGSTSVYGVTKREADEAVRASELRWTILRPSIIYGSGERGLVARTLRIMRQLPFVPVVGPGTNLIRPVHVDDVAGAALSCISAPSTIGKSYMIGGRDEITMDEFFRGLADAHGVGRPIVHLPYSFALPLARVLGGFLAHPPITTDNILGVMEAPRVEPEAASSDFGFAPRGFAEGMRSVAAENARDDRAGTKN